MTDSGRPQPPGIETQKAVVSATLASSPLALSYVRIAPVCVSVTVIVYFDVGQGAVEHPVVAVGRVSVEHFDDELDVGIVEEPEVPGVAGQRHGDAVAGSFPGPALPRRPTRWKRESSRQRAPLPAVQSAGARSCAGPCRSRARRTFRRAPRPWPARRPGWTRADARVGRRLRESGRVGTRRQMAGRVVIGRGPRRSACPSR